ncbi:hypothetical protein SAMN05660493_01538 [Epilithonimonas bovis DSM 19482]|uniref:Uncharacterized protein n=1 Tax=Epilithonimonas bovis DSM 19482 TaxID=1121284 RepID=A0A1U7PXY6_9FLAO|nr:hypothetical protein [Epilithonimonas bovis]SIT96843.1 hypothetical protein SAMN05660493_01538 [Epilithonimonas bovis DSM 19482]
MNNNTLPQEELKKYGIINEDNSFSKKLSSEDIEKFLNGYTIVADNEKNRIAFKLTDNNSRLNVNLFERDRDFEELLEKSKEKVQYSDVKKQYDIKEDKSPDQLNFSKLAFVFDKETNTVREYDMIKNASELTKVILEKNNALENEQYRLELQKLKNVLYDKIDQYPEIAKDIKNDLNIVDKEIDTISNVSENTLQKEKSVDLDVNDKDMYEDANREREEKFQDEREEEMDRPRGRGR